jgi:hypothetical protein
MTWQMPRFVSCEMDTLKSPDDSRAPFQVGLEGKQIRTNLLKGSRIPFR